MASVVAHHHFDERLPLPHLTAAAAAEVAAWRGKEISAYSSPRQPNNARPVGRPHLLNFGAVLIRERGVDLQPGRARGRRRMTAIVAAAQIRRELEVTVVSCLLPTAVTSQLSWQIGVALIVEENQPGNLSVWPNRKSGERPRAAMFRRDRYR
mgnify:CR=1 FL=1